MDRREGSEFTRSVLLNGRKIGPTNEPTEKSTSSTAENPSYCSNLHSTSLYTQNDNLEKSQPTGFNMRRPLVKLNSTRWCPTPEQLDVLEEIYRCGIRTPTAEKIQQIAANLRRFGEVEGKNVFYWFQNHKARERQKRRRLQGLSSRQQPSDVERKESGFSRRREFEVSQAMNKTTSSNCSILSEESVSMHRAAGVLSSENSRDGWNWIQFEERESLEERERNTQTKHAGLQLMNTTMTTSSSITTSSPKALGMVMDSKLSSAGNLSNIPWSTPNNRETQMLQLFPDRSDDGSFFNKDSDEVAMTAMDTGFTPNKFFEFLPLKN